MKAREYARVIIKRFEGCTLKPYRCPAGVWTIGYGHTGLCNLGAAEPIPANDVLCITQGQAESLLDDDIAAIEKEIIALCSDLSECRKGALISLAFNVGIRALLHSTLLKLALVGRHISAAQEFDKWTKATVNGEKVVLPGLVKRRAAERALYESK